MHAPSSSHAARAGFCYWLCREKIRDRHVREETFLHDKRFAYRELAFSPQPIVYGAGSFSNCDGNLFRFYLMSDHFGRKIWIRHNQSPHFFRQTMIINQIIPVIRKISSRFEKYSGKPKKLFTVGHLQYRMALEDNKKCVKNLLDFLMRMEFGQLHSHETIH
jgi:hypothetical protein